MPIYLSASSIADFVKCSQRVMYRIQKPFKPDESREMVIGKISHEVLEKYWDDMDKALLTAEQLCKTNSVDSSGRMAIKNHIGTFFHSFRPLVKEGDKIEYTFKTKLYDDVFLVGRMDRISGVSIFDWKTKSRIPFSLKNDVQSIIYNHVANDIIPNGKQELYVASLVNGRLVRYEEEGHYVDELFSRIIPRMIKTIRFDGYEKLGMFNGSCYRCQFKRGCLPEASGLEKESGYELDSPEFAE